MKIRREWTRYRREAGFSEHHDQLRYQEKGENENNTKSFLGFVVVVVVVVFCFFCFLFCSVLCRSSVA